MCIPTGVDETQIRIGTAGWSIPRAVAAEFPGDGAHIVRYSRVLNCAEINATFYRAPMPGTFVKWAAAVPDGFQFAVKAPKTITHECALRPAPELLPKFLGEVRGLGAALGPVLFQLPPKQGFDANVARDLFAQLRSLEPMHEAVVEARHASWFTAEADALLREFALGRVLADPLKGVDAWPAADAGAGMLYCRLHGWPRVYYSAYEDAFLRDVAERMLRAKADGRPAWCIFDNTASGAAANDALRLQRMIAAMRGRA